MKTQKEIKPREERRRTVKDIDYNSHKNTENEVLKCGFVYDAIAKIQGSCITKNNAAAQSGAAAKD